MPRIPRRQDKRDLLFTNLVKALVSDPGLERWQIDARWHRPHCKTITKARLEAKRILKERHDRKEG